MHGAMHAMLLRFKRKENIVSLQSLEGGSGGNVSRWPNVYMGEHNVCSEDQIAAQ
jgi:hypothetical protein